MASMFDTPGSVKTLRQYWTDRTALPDPVQLSKELTGESDRAAVILMGTLLDDALIFLLMNRLVLKPDKKQADYIFRFNGPLGSFSARTEVAYLFGFIDENIRSQLNDIREMRNACAHTKQPMSFQVPALLNVARRLFRPTGITAPVNHTPEAVRSSFLIETIVLFQTLIEGSREAGIAAVRQMLDDPSL